MIIIPSGMELFIPEDKTYNLDIILYKTGKGNPYSPVEGKWYWERTFYAHPNMGPDEKYMVCPYKTCNKPCPVCEEYARMRKDPDADEEMVNSLRPKERQMFLVRNKDEDFLRLFEFSWWKFGRLLDDLRDSAEDDEIHIKDFDDDTAGSTLRVTFKSTKKYGAEARSISFERRPKGIPEEWLEHGICLDSLLIVPTYDQLKSMFVQGEGEPGRIRDDEPEENYEEEEPTSDDFQEGDEAVCGEMGVVTIKAFNKSRTKVKVEDADGNVKVADVSDLSRLETDEFASDEEDDMPFDDEPDVDEEWD